jgi:hypothetical protein
MGHRGKHDGEERDAILDGRWDGPRNGRWDGRWRFWAMLAALWTLPWTVMGVQDVLGATILGQTGLSGGLSAHAVFQIVFVAAYTGVRWMAGMFVLAVVAVIVEWPMHRSRVEA